MQVNILRTRSWTPIAISAAALLALTGLAAPAQAAPRSGSTTASLAAPLAQPRQQILNGVLWKCAGERCTAPADGSRAVVSCQRVARTFGTVASFVTPAGAITPEELTRCNAS
jgi:hypothetical protein